MVLVVLFLVLILGLWGQCTRQIGSLIRIEQARANRVRDDATQAPAAYALARCLAALEQGFPPSASYACLVVAPDGSSFAATFELDALASGQWVVSVSPSSDYTLPPLDPSQFVAAPPTNP